MTFISTCNSPLGIITLASDGENLTGLWLENQKYFRSNVLEPVIIENKLKVFQNTKDWLNSYFDGERPLISEIRLKPNGTEFRKTVWEILCRIPYGQLSTYKDIADEISNMFGKNMSARAVGGAVGHNPISIIIPCHRVVSVNGDLTGYSGGIERKIRLLRLEGIDLSC